MMKNTVSFESGVGSVTGANFLLTIDKGGQSQKKILIDCGLIQGDKEAELENYNPFPYNPKDIDYLFVTHAHLDHVGRIGKLCKEGFHGIIFSTPETKSLAELIMTDAQKILEKDAKISGIDPLYTTEDVSLALSKWQTIPYYEERVFNQGLFSIYMRDAGHILGSAMIRFSIKSGESNDQNDNEKNKTNKTKNIVFTGDLGNTPTPLLRDTDVVDDADYIVMESVYGDRNHEPKAGRREKFKKIVIDTIERQGTVVIPAFSLERTQVLLYELNDLVEKKEIPSVPVFVDSPLAINVTGIYKESTHLFNDEAKARIKSGDDIFSFPRLSFTPTNLESKTIDHTKAPKIVIAGSGMSMGGRVTHHESLYLPDPRNTIMLVGYQPVGTIGRKLQDGVKKIEIWKEKIKVNAHIESVLGYSAHKDSDNLVDFVGDSARTGRLKKVFTVMGEPKSAMFLAQKLRDTYGIDAVHPERGSEFEF